MTDKQLFKWIERGIFPRPEEDKEAFLKRAAKYPAFQPEEEHEEAGVVTKPLFQFTVDWMPIVYSNNKLSCWEGAATWIDPNDFPYVQLRKKFKKGSYFGISRKEVLAHEAVHAARMAYNEPVFEELLAYRTSPRKLRRLLGPLFRSPLESLLFLSAILGASFCAALGLFYAMALPGGLVAWFGGRLAYAQRTLGKAEKKFPLSVLVWMTDKEIRQVAKEGALKLGDSFRDQALAELCERYSSMVS